MKTMKSLLICLLMLATSSVLPAGESTSITRHVGKGGFSLDTPREWVVVSREGLGSLNASTRLFDLLPADSRVQSRIYVVYYPGKVPSMAQMQWEAFTPDGNEELPRIENQPGWIILGQAGRIRTAYYQIGGGTLVFDLKGTDYEQGEKAFLALVRSFKDLGNVN